MAAGSFGGGGLGFGLRMILEDAFSGVADRIRESMQNLDTATDSAAESIQASFGKMAAGVGMVMSGMQLLEPLKKAMDARSEFEVYEAQFTTLLKSAEAAKTAMDNIRQDALDNPVFGTKGLVAANAAMISTGKIGAEQARRVTNNLANALAAVGKGDEELARMSANLQQIGNLGKATSMDIKQFGMAGLPIFTLLEQSTGKSTKELDKMDITLEMLDEAFTKAAGAGGMFEGGMERMAKTSAALKAAFEENVTNTFADWGKMIEPVTKALYSVLGDLLQTLRNFVATPFGKVLVWVVTLTLLAGAFILVTGGLTMIATAIWPVIKAMWAMNVAFMASPIGWFVIAVMAAVAAVMALKMIMDKSSASWNGYKDSMANAAKTKEDLLAKQEKGIKLTEEETESLNKALATLKGGWDEYYNSLSPIERAMTNIGTIFEAIGEMFQYSDTEFIGMSEGMAERLKEMGLYEFAINVGEWIVAIKNFFAGLWEGLQPLITTFKEIFNTLKDSFMAIWDTLKSAIESIFGSFNAGGQEMSSFANIGKTVAKIITMAFKPLVWILQLIAWVIRNLVVPVIQFFIKIMTPFYAAIVQGIKWIIQGMVWLNDRWDAIWNGLWGAISWLWDKFVGFLGWWLSLPGRFLQFGINIMKGLWNGFKSMFPAIAEWIEGMVNKFVGKILGMIDKIKNGLKAAWNWVTGNDDTTPSAQPAAVTASGSVVPMPMSFEPSAIGGMMANNLGQQWQPSYMPKGATEKVTDKRTEQVNVTLQIDGDKVADAMIDKLDMKKARNNE